MSNGLDEGRRATVMALEGCVALSPVFRGTRIEVVHWRCLREAGRAGERFHPWAVLSLTDAGASVVHRPRGRTLVNPATTALHEAGAPYRTSHPFGCGDEGCNVALSPEVTREIRARPGAQGEDGDEGVWPAGQAIVPARPRLELFVLVRRLRRGLPVSAMAIEEAVLGLVAGVLEGLSQRRGRRPPTGRATTRESHRALVESVEDYFVGHLGRSIQLSEVAAAARVSPFHLARTFRQATGLTLHRYLTRLRLLSALPGAAGPRGSLTELALDLGFSSHSHLTAAFRREFGVPPSEVRRRSTAAR